MNDMTRARASRLTKPQPRGKTFLSDWLPIGTIQRKLVLRVIVPILILFVIITFVDKVVMPVITRQGTSFPLPDFTEQSLNEAQASLAQLDLKYEISSEEFSPGKAEGVILQQFPKAGTNVKPDRTIMFITSLGQKIVHIPELAGKSVRQAMLDLETGGLELGEIAWAFSDTIPERVVVFSYPASGTEIPLGSYVNLMVNRGRASNFTYMPKIIGITIDEALKKLEDKSLKAGIISNRIDENYLPETVLEQSESEGSELDVGTEIDIVVSTI